MTNAPAAVKIKNLSFSYPGKTKHAPVLGDLSLSIEPGEIFGVLGPNGGGKSTLFKILSTALRFDQGQIEIFGIDLKKDPGAVRKKIGVVFQNPSLDKKLTLLENVRLQGSLYGLGGVDLSNRIHSVFTKLDLESRASDFVEHLSGGLQRRGEIAKGLLHRPQLLLMDEPSTGLDPGARRDLWNLIVDLKKDGVTTMVTTHLMEEGDKCDRVAILHKGTCVALNTPVELKRQIGGDVVIIHADEPQKLAEQIQSAFTLAPLLVDDTIRIEMSDGHTFIPKVVEKFPGFINAVSVGKPTLEDVFVHVTGRTFKDEHV